MTFLSSSHVPKYLTLEALQLGEQAFALCREATCKGEKPYEESPTAGYPTEGRRLSYDEEETITQLNDP